MNTNRTYAATCAGYDPLIANPLTAVRVIAVVLNFHNVRQVGDGLWKLGSLHGRVMYYASKPTRELLARLQNDSHAIFIYGSVGVGFKSFPKSCASRGRAISEIIRWGFGGEWLLDEEALDRLAPKFKSGIINGRRGNESFALRRAEWYRFMMDWYKECRISQNARRPSWKEVLEWFSFFAMPAVRREKPSIRTLQRDVKKLTQWNGKGEDLRSSDFALLWNKCDDLRFVLNDSQDFQLPKAINAAFPRCGHGCAPDAIRPLFGGHNAYQSVD